MKFPVSRPGAGETSSLFGYTYRRHPSLCRALLVGLWSIVMVLASFGVANAGARGGSTDAVWDGGVTRGRQLDGHLRVSADGAGIGADRVGVNNSAQRESYPGPANTGVPAGTVLRRSGSITAATDGQVIDGLDIVGCVLVTADNVVIRRSRITCEDRYSIRTRYASNLLVEDVEIDGQGVNEAAVCCANYTLRRLDISNALDGPRLADNTVVEDSWIHHLHRRAGSHNDTLQTTGATNMVVRGNALEAYHPENGDPMNACLMIGSTTGPIVANLLVEGNYCNGGNYSIGIRLDLNASNIRIRDNTFGRDHQYGVVARPHPGVIWDASSNIYLDDLRPVTG